MAAKLEIKDGNPVWASDAIIPSRDTLVSPGLSPAVAAIEVNSNDVFVYVKVDNIGTVGLGQCTCNKTGPWAEIVLFPNFIQNKNLSGSDGHNGFTFTYSNAGNTLKEGNNILKSFGVSVSGKRAWAWSPDGLFFAYVSSPGSDDWYLKIIALQDVTRSDGTTVAKGQVIGDTNGICPWDNGNFGWAGSKAVSASGMYPGGGGIVRSLTCPLASGPNVWSELIPDFPGKLGWVYLVSPCESVVAYVPKIIDTTLGSREAFLISTATARQVPFRKNNVQTAVSITGNSPSITTSQHAASGVQVNTGSGTVTVDDPDCTLAGGGIVVRVDRVKASTLPSANLGVVPIGSAVLHALGVNKSHWVQVPNQNGWANQSESHWCLLAQAYTNDGTTIPRPWDGQATKPPTFPVNKENCAQRNFEILP